MKRNFCALIATGLSPWQLKTHRKWASCPIAWQAGSPKYRCQYTHKLYCLISVKNWKCDRVFLKCTHSTRDPGKKDWRKPQRDSGPA